MKKRVISVFLAISMVLGLTLGVSSKGNGAQEARAKNTKSTEDVSDVVRMGEGQRYTNRFIIKYTAESAGTDRSEAVKQRALTVAGRDDIKKLDTSQVINEAKGMDVRRRPDGKNAGEAKSVTNARVSKVARINADVIELDAAVETEAYVQQLKSELGDSAVEYIQPDYKLYPSSQAYSPDPGLSGQAEQTEAPSAAPEVTPVYEATAEPDIPDAGVQTSLPQETPTAEPAPVNAVGIDGIMGSTPADITAAHTLSAGQGVKIALIDSGLDVTHPDLTGRLAAGYDFVNDTDLTYDNNNVMGQIHATHIAGVIASVAPQAQIMPLKVFEGGSAYTSDIIDAIEYAEQNGATIANCSFGSGEDNPALREVIQSSDMLFVCAAGNGRKDVDTEPVYPASYGFDNVVSVTSLNADMGFSYYSNYGTESVDIAALGRNVESSYPGGGYGELSGTSVSTAYVSGAAALAAALSAGQQAPADLKIRLKNTSYRLSNLQNKVSGASMLGIYNCVAGVTDPTIVPVSPADDFDVHGYQPTAEESWELFSSLPNKQVAAVNPGLYVLKNNGSVWGCSGQGAVQIEGLTGIVQISAGDGHILALDQNGNVWGWGWNDYHQISESSELYVTPMQIPGLSGIVQMDAGYYHNAAVKSDGTVQVWGGSFLPPSSGFNGVCKVKVGGTSILAMKTDGTLWVWGRYQPIPQEIEEMSGVDDIDVGGYYYEIDGYDGDDVLAVKDGSLWTWKEFGGGLATPQCVSSLSDVASVSVSLSFYQSCMVVKNDGTVWAWGDNNDGQLGDGTTTDRATPVQAVGLSGVKQAAVGSYDSIALKQDGAVWIWGYGTSSNRDMHLSAVLRIPDLQGDITASTYNERYVLADGYVRELTTSGAGEIILGDTSQVSAGCEHRLALKDDKTVWAWGENDSGQLGDGTTASRSTPAPVAGLSNVKQVFAGAFSSFVVKEDGSLWTWGATVPYMSESDMLSPVQISGLSDVASVSASYGHVLVLKNDGTVWAWGENTFGQLGNGTTQTSYAPVQVSGLTNVKAIDAADNSSVAVKNDGTVWTWGSDNFGELGNGTFDEPSSIPVQVTGLTGIEQVDSGGIHCVALKNDGTVWTWGANELGQLGNGTFENSNTPVKVLGLTNAANVSAGYYSSFARTKGGLGYAWGDNEWGQAGQPLSTGNLLPHQIIADDMEEYIYQTEMEDATLSTLDDGHVVAGYTVGQSIQCEGGEYAAATGTNLEHAGPWNCWQTAPLKASFAAYKSGSYYIWMRVCTSTASQGAACIMADDQYAYTFVNIPVTSSGGGDVWLWKKAAVINLTAGEHVLSIIPQGAGGKFDSMLITDNANYTPWDFVVVE